MRGKRSRQRASQLTASLLIAGIIGTGCPAAALAATQGAPSEAGASQVAGSLTYQENDEGGITVTGLADEGVTDLVIPDTLGGLPVTAIGESAFAESGLTSVAMPDTVRTIGDYAFNKCTNLTSASLSEALEQIGWFAFAGCAQLKEVALPKGLRVLGGSAFLTCTSLESITIPAGTQVGLDSFRWMSDDFTVYVQTKQHYDMFSAYAGNSDYPQHVAYAEGYPKAAESIALDRATATINVGDAMYPAPDAVVQLRLDITPSEAAPDSEVRWSVSGDDAVYLNAWSDDNTRCSVVGKSPGTAVVTAEVDGLTASCTVQVIERKDVAVLLNDRPLECEVRLDVGDAERWVVSDTSVARITATWSVDHGTYKSAKVSVTPLKTGQATLSCYVGDDLMYQWDITVSEGGAYYLDEAAISGVLRSYPLTAGGVEPKPTVAIGDITLREGVDYTLEYENNDAVGTATMIITGIGQCVGTRTLTFEITEGSGEEPAGPGGDVGPSGPGKPSDPTDPDPDDAVDPDYPALDRPFPDVASGTWYYEAVCKAGELGIMNGYADTGLFGPDDPLAREQAAGVLYNYLGQDDKTSPVAAHTDVAQGQWYSDAVNWAVEKGIMGGYANTSLFGIGDLLTREQFAAVIANACGADVAAVDRSVLNQYPDGDEYSAWAADALAWAVDVGVINGVQLRDGTLELRATETMTRAQMAAMMVNAIEQGVFG